MNQYHYYHHLILKKAHHYKGRSRFLDFEELVAEGGLVYTECVKSYQESKSNFVTWLNNNLDYRFINLTSGTRCKKRGRKPAGGKFGKSIMSYHTGSDNIMNKCTLTEAPETILDFIPPDTLRLVRIIIKEEPHNLKALKMILREKGWKWKSIKYAIGSIKNSLQEIKWKGK